MKAPSFIKIIWLVDGARMPAFDCMAK